MLVSTGIALLQFNRFLEKESRIKLGEITIILSPPESPGVPKSKPIAVTAIVMGIVTLIVGFCRFYIIQYFLQRNQFPVARAGATLMLLMGLITAGLYFGLTVRPKYS